MSKKTIILIVSFSLFYVLSLLSICLYFNNRQPLIINNTSTPISTIVPTVIPTKTESVEMSYQAKLIQDDKSSTSKLVLIDQNQKETIIKEIKYYTMAGQILKPIFSDFTFSPDYSFLSYESNSGYESSATVLYNIKNQKETTIDFSSEIRGFTSDSKYFYACSEAGMNGSGATIIQLDQFKKMFSITNNNSFVCKYDQAKEEVLFSEVEVSDSSKIISQYLFSEKLGSVSKIK